MSEPLVTVDKATVDKYEAAGFWRRETLADTIRANAAANAAGTAYQEGASVLTWAQYDELSDRLAGDLMAAGMERGGHAALLLPDGPGVHVAFVAGEKAGVVLAGIGPRAGDREIEHLLRKSRATVFITEAEHHGRPMAELVKQLRAAGLPIAAHIVIDRLGHGPGKGGRPLDEISRRRLGPNDLWLLNSTSGTTGLPKCVMQFQNRWWYFHRLAVEAGGLSANDRFLGLVPAPFGFGLWTAHFSPSFLGAPTIVQARFNAEEALDLIEREQPTFIACVSTQFVMMLNTQAQRPRNLRSLRVMFTGGEAVPYERAAEFEQQTGALVLQFYGSNETGALSRTTLTDSRDNRLRTCGRVIPDLQVRLLDDDGRDVPRGHPGQPACRGAVTCMGYFEDDKANAELFTKDGWMTTGDIATVDEEGYLRLAGRKADFIIRGGKNVSAVAVEEAVATYPGVAQAAAVSMPDKVFGERVCCYVVMKGGASLTLEQLAVHLGGRGVSKENFPERLVFVEALPMSSGGKIAKGELRADIRKRIAAGN
jgi:acyl-CoA synthetase